MPKIKFFDNNFTSSKTYGFTLIELLVTIAIIAIISVVAVALFGNIQADARDGKRKAELETIANALEVNKTSGGGAYNPLSLSQFSGSVFPSGSEALDAQGYPFCISVSANTTVPGNPAALTGWSSGTTNCPSGSPTYTKITTSVPENTTLSWKICTRLENKGTPTIFCRTNTQ